MGLLGSIIGQVGGFVANKATDFLLGNYNANKAWSRQKQAAQSAHQWEVADLKAAGLNPILSATGGNGANLPSVAVAQTANSEAPNIIGMMSALQGIRNQEQQENVLKAQENLLKTQAYRELDSSTLLRAQTAQINTNNYIPAVFNARMMDNLSCVIRWLICIRLSATKMHLVNLVSCLVVSSNLALYFLEVVKWVLLRFGIGLSPLV